MEKKAEGYVLSSLLLKIRFFTNLFARGSKEKKAVDAQDDI